jgi:HEAT repeat protein
VDDAVSRLLPILTIVCATATAASSNRSYAADDPEIRGRKVSAWFKFLREEKDARRRQAALQIIDLQAGPKVAVVFPGLLRELREHPDTAIRARIAQLLLKYKDKGDDLTKALTNALENDKDAKVREAAATTLGRLDRMGFVTVPELTKALKDQAPTVRAAAADALGQFSAIDGEIARDAIPLLSECLKDSSTPVRMNVVLTLARMGPAAATATPALAESLANDKEDGIRKECAKALAFIGKGADSAAPALIKALGDSSSEVRQYSAYALGRISPDPKVVLPELLKAIKDKDKTVRGYAIHAIGSLGKAATPAIPELIRVLKDDVVAEVRLAAIEELASFGPDAKAALDALTIASRDGKPAIREAAQDALKKIQQSP